jgi:hypothetical protein
MIPVNPRYQHQGRGSMLLQCGCEEADVYGRDSILISSPAAKCLYSKFGSMAIEEVHTSAGTFTSMFKEAQVKHELSS